MCVVYLVISSVPLFEHLFDMHVLRGFIKQGLQ